MVMLSVKARRLSRARGARFALALQRERTRNERRLAARLRAFFVNQAQRVLRRFAQAEGVSLKAQTFALTVTDPLERKATTGELFPGDEEAARLARIVVPVTRDQALASGNLAAELVGVEGLVRESPELTRLMRQAGTRIRAIDRATRTAVREQLRIGAERGYSPFQIANGVPADGYAGIRSTVKETYRGRADSIARTELATSSQDAAHDRYGVAKVTEVDILDGPNCGWLNHNDPDLANGSRRSLDDAADHPLAHPNCVRVSVPVLS